MTNRYPDLIGPKPDHATPKENLHTKVRVVKVYSPTANGRSLKARFVREGKENG